MAVYEAMGVHPSVALSQVPASNSGMLHQHVVIYVGPHIYETIMKYNSIHLKHSSLSVSFNLVPYKGLDCLHQDRSNGTSPQVIDENFQIDP